MRDPSNKKLRWLQVAVKASELRVLSAASELVPVARQASEAEQRHLLARDALHQAQSQWRSRLSGAGVFHADEDRQFRQFGGRLAAAERRHGEAHDAARDRLSLEQAALRQGLAQKNGLTSALERAHGNLQDEQARRVQRENDEGWCVRRIEGEDT